MGRFASVVRWRKATARLNTSNGSLVITLPASAQFAVDADTSNGKITSDFAVTAQDFSDNQSARHGRIGSGHDVGTTHQQRPIDIRQSR